LMPIAQSLGIMDEFIKTQIEKGEHPLTLF
jgi:hypothetical protein